MVRARIRAPPVNLPDELKDFWQAKVESGVGLTPMTMLARGSEWSVVASAQDWDPFARLLLLVAAFRLDRCAVIVDHVSPRLRCLFAVHGWRDEPPLASRLLYGVDDAGVMVPQSLDLVDVPPDLLVAFRVMWENPPPPDPRIVPLLVAGLVAEGSFVAVDPA